MKKIYELIKDGMCVESHEKCREGLKVLIESAEAIIEEDYADSLMIVCTTYTALGSNSVKRFNRSISILSRKIVILSRKISTKAWTEILTLP